MKPPYSEHSMDYELKPFTVELCPLCSNGLECHKSPDFSCPPQRGDQYKDGVKYRTFHCHTNQHYYNY